MAPISKGDSADLEMMEITDEGTDQETTADDVESVEDSEEVSESEEAVERGTYEEAADEEVDEVTKRLWKDGRPIETKRSKLPKKDQNRFEFHQSRADKAEAKTKALEDKLLMQEPIMRYIEANPAVLQAIDSQIASDDSPREEVVDGAKELPTRPVKPTKPASYDKIEAITDPNSESAKYNVQVADYLEEFATYQDAVDAKRSQVEQVRQRAAQEEVQRKQTLSATFKELVTKYNFSEAEARDFLVTMTNPQSRSMENLVKFYKVTKGKAAARKAEGLRSRQDASRVIPPLAVMGGEGDSTLSEEDDFNMSLLTETKPRFTKVPKKR